MHSEKIVTILNNIENIIMGKLLHSRIIMNIYLCLPAHPLFRSTKNSSAKNIKKPKFIDSFCILESI